MPLQTLTYLRLEGLAILSLSVFAYAQSGSSWLLFAFLLFVPDIFMLGYLANPRLGARVYNLGHTYLTPTFILVPGLVGNLPVTIAIGIIWFAHIGLDRLLGYGLKSPSGFKHTHLA